MLKRQQILLDDWQGEYMKFVAEQYDMSISEAVRTLLCMGILHSISSFYPQYKPGVSTVDLVKKIKKMQAGNIDEAEFHGLMSKLFFEARKAAEYRVTHAAKLRK